MSKLYDAGLRWRHAENAIKWDYRDDGLGFATLISQFGTSIATTTDLAHYIKFYSEMIKIRSRLARRRFNLMGGIPL